MRDKVRDAIIWSAFSHFEQGFALVDDGNPITAKYDVTRHGAKLGVKVWAEGSPVSRDFTIQVTEHK